MLLNDDTAVRSDSDVVRLDNAQLRLVLEHLPSLCWIANADGFIFWYNRSWHDYCGTTAQQMEGWGWQSVHDPAVLPSVLARWSACIVSGAPFEMTFPLKSADGKFRPFLTRVNPVRDESNTVQWWVGTNTDASGQEEIALALRQTSEAQKLDALFLNSVLSASEDCIKVLDLDAKLIFMTAHSLEALEISDFNAVAHCPWPDFWKDDGNAAALNAINEAQQGRIGRFSGYCETMRGTPKWWDVIVTPILGLDGHPEKLLAVSRDISELKEGEERQKLLAQELAHRVKNILSIVETLSTQTFRGAQSVEEMRSAFSARLMALSRAHDVLLDTSWTDAGLANIVSINAELYAPGNPSRFKVSGKDIRLGPKAALDFAMVLHELSTNAVKYGALSVLDGKVEISWTLEDNGVDPNLSFHWQEVGGPSVVQPTRTGFGSKLIGSTFSGRGGSKATLSFPPSGASFRFIAPLKSLQQS